MPIAIPSAAKVHQATDEQINARIEMLCDEIDANETENVHMQEEIDTLYAELDRRKEMK